MAKTKIFDKLNPKNADFIGSEFQLNYTPRGKFQTKLGGFIWIGVILSMMAVSFTSFKSLFSTDSPVVTVSNLYSRQAPHFDLYEQKIFFHLGFRNKGLIYPTKAGMSQINRYVTIKGFIQKNKINSKTGTKELDYVLNLNYKPCSQVKDQRVLEDFQWHEQSKVIADNLGICPELEEGPEKYFISSKPHEPPHYVLVIYFYPCSLPDAADCAPLSEFQGAEMLLSNTKKAFDITNYEKPLSSVIEFEGAHMLEPETSKKLFYKVRDYEVWDDNRDFFDKDLRSKSAGYFFDYRDTRKRDSGQLHCDEAALDDPHDVSCLPFFTITLESSGEKQVIVRTYPKFFMTLGEIGGTAEIMILVAVLVYFNYNNYYLRKYIKKVFRVESTPELKEIFSQKNIKKNSNYPPATPQSPNRILQDEESNIKRDVEKRSTNPRQVIYPRSSPYSPKKFHEGVDELLNLKIEENLSGIALFKSLNHLEILSRIFFKPRHRKLLPVILLNLVEEEKKINKESNNSEKRGQIFEETNVEKEMTLEQAYNRVRNSEPESEVERMLDEFMMAHAPDYFKESKRIKPFCSDLTKSTTFKKIIPQEIKQIPLKNNLKYPQLGVKKSEKSDFNFGYPHPPQSSQRSLMSNRQRLIPVKSPMRVSIMNEEGIDPGGRTDEPENHEGENTKRRNHLSWQGNQRKTPVKDNSLRRGRGIVISRARSVKKMRVSATSKKPFGEFSTNTRKVVIY